MCARAAAFAGEWGIKMERRRARAGGVGEGARKGETDSVCGDVRVEVVGCGCATPPARKGCGEKKIEME